MTFPIAHRGLSARHPENSLAAIEAALEHVPVVEIDVRCTHDAVPVCTHDPSLWRTHELDAHIGRLDLSELRTHAPEVPTLSEVLDLVASAGGAAMLDVKVTRPRAIDAVERVVAASPMCWNEGRQLRRGEPLEPGTLSFQSADAQLLQAFRSRTGAGCLELVQMGSSVRELLVTAPLITTYAQGVTIPDSFATAATLRLLRGLRLGSYVYTVNDPDRYAELVRLGASGVYSDVVDEVAAVA